MEQIFPGKVELLHCVTAGFINLSVLKEDDRGFVVDENKLKQFAQLDEINQYTLLCVASQGRFSRSGLVRQARLLLDVVSGISETGYTRTGLLRSAFLVSEKDNDIPGMAPIGQSGRFASMLARSREAEGGTGNAFSAMDAISTMDRLIDSALLLGLLTEKGKDECGESIFVKGSIFANLPRPTEPPFPKVLNIDAGFTVTLLPGLPLSELIPLMQFMEIQQFDTAAQFEITKKSVMRAFDAGMNHEQVLDTLTQFCPYEVPQNLCVSLEDWSNSYSSVALYKGYILQANKENAAAIERNPAISQHIALTLAPGIYLLDVENDVQAKALIAASGVDFIGTIKSALKPAESASFPTVWYGHSSVAGGARKAYAFAETEQEDQNQNIAALSSETDRAKHFDSMRDELEKLNLLPEQKEGLLDRIKRKIILSPVQLRGDSVRLERIAASGMDFSGKVHIIESAISSNSMVELEYENPNDAEGEGIMIVGNPLNVEKLDDDALIRIELIPQHEEKLFSIGKARMVKRIRGSVLK
ncbi:MAG: helicase-associated domain-containing protein [Treponema sp.]|nr:helicase-associated domain-containing protein [Treponema sp.]